MWTKAEREVAVGRTAGVKDIWVVEHGRIAIRRFQKQNQLLSLVDQMIPGKRADRSTSSRATRNK